MCAKSQNCAIRHTPEVGWIFIFYFNFGLFVVLYEKNDEI